MTENTEEVEITVTYRPVEQRGEIHCQYPGDDPQHRGELSEELHSAVNRAVCEVLESEDVFPIAGGENGQTLGTVDDIPQG